MTSLAAFKEIFSFFLKRGFKARRTRLFFIISLIPVLILLIAKVIEIVNPGAGVSAADIISKILLIIYIQLLLPILALFFGTSIVTEEIENKTLAFLTTSPVPKAAIVLGKYVSYFLVSLVIIDVALLLSFIIININHFNDLIYYREFLTFFYVGILALSSYMAFFLFLGTWLKKSLILGLMFIFGWESIVHYLPGVTQKFTLIHYIKSLLPVTSESVKFLIFKLEPSTVFESIVVLSGITLVSLVAAAFIFKHKEYILSDVNQ